MSYQNTMRQEEYGTPGRSRNLLGRILRPVRAGEKYLAWNDPKISGAPDTILLTSPDFMPDGSMPQCCAGVGIGDNLSPALDWAGIPPHTVDLAIIVQDPDAPMLRPVLHLLVCGLNPERPGVPQGFLSPAANQSLIFGRGSFGRIGYHGPRPPAGHGAHRYFFQIFALDRRLIFATHWPTYDEVIAKMEGSVLARGKLVGTFERI